MSTIRPTLEKRSDAQPDDRPFSFAQLPNGTDLTNLDRFVEYSEARAFAEDTIRRLTERA